MASMKQLKKRVSGKHGKLFLGLDLSTQALKAMIIDQAGQVCHETAVSFDHNLPEFKTKGGVRRDADGLTVTSPSLMWVSALDLLLRRLRTEKKLLAGIVAISGSGQQHGSVYLRQGTASIFNALDPVKSLRVQLANYFSIEKEFANCVFKLLSGSSALRMAEVPCRR